MVTIILPSIKIILMSNSRKNETKNFIEYECTGYLINDNSASIIRISICLITRSYIIVLYNM
jgi:hypothetical protein